MLSVMSLIGLFLATKLADDFSQTVFERQLTLDEISSRQHGRALFEAYKQVSFSKHLCFRFFRWNRAALYGLPENFFEII